MTGVCFVGVSYRLIWGEGRGGIRKSRLGTCRSIRFRQGNGAFQVFNDFNLYNSLSQLSI